MDNIRGRKPSESTKQGTFKLIETEAAHKAHMGLH